MKKLILTAALLSFAFQYGQSQKSYETYTNEEIVKLSNHISELELKASLYDPLRIKYEELEKENLSLKNKQKSYLDSLDALFLVKSEAIDRKLEEQKAILALSNEEQEINRQLVDFLKKIQFNVGSYNIKDDLIFKLDIVADILKKFETTRYEIIGFADTTGSYANNMVLSKKRAIAVKKYLVSKGIAADRLIAIGQGEETLTVSTTSSALRNSRRAELRKIDEEVLTLNKN